MTLDRVVLQKPSSELFITQGLLIIFILLLFQMQLDFIDGIADSPTSRLYGWLNNHLYGLINLLLNIM